MTPAAPRTPPYRAVFLPTEIERLRGWGRWARQAGGPIWADFTRTARTVQYRLEHEPLEWGDPNFTLHALGLDMRFGTFLMFNVHYGVSKRDPIVYVRRLLFVTSYPLGQPPAD